ATLVLPRLEAPRVVEHPMLFALRPWSETEDPVAVVAELLDRAPRARLAISDRCWATFVLQLQARLPAASWLPASIVTAPLRAVKDAAEVAALRRAANAADRVATDLVTGAIADRKSTRLNSSHQIISYAVFCLKKKKNLTT